LHDLNTEYNIDTKTKTRTNLQGLDGFKLCFRLRLGHDTFDAEVLRNSCCRTIRVPSKHYDQNPTRLATVFKQLE